MEINLQIVRGVFQGILAGRMSREQADRWAYAAVQQKEAGTLTCSPLADEERIWAGVMYLYGVDTMEASGEYLHTDADVNAAMELKLGKAA